MNKNRLKKMLAIILTILVVIFCNYNVVFGSNFDGVIGGFNGGKDTTGHQFVKDILKTILTVIRIFASGLAAIVITVLGIKYMMAAPSEKAQIKSQLINFTIGIVVVIAATGIIEIVRNFAQEATTSN